MPITLKKALILVLLAYLFIIFKSVKHRKMRINYLITWTVIEVSLIIALFVPNFVDNLSNWLGFKVPSNMIFTAAIFLIFYLLFDISKLITSEQNRNNTLIQEISILKEKVEKLEKTEKENNDE